MHSQKRERISEQDLTMSKVSMTIGLDVGSTTIKGIVMDSMSGSIVWERYERHEAKLASTVLKFLDDIEKNCNVAIAECPVFVTGSGGGALVHILGGRFVQEVNAIAVAVERLCPDVGSVIELGGQDAKMIMFVRDPSSGQLSKVPTMNDKCAGGTGAVIDKICTKLGIPQEQLGTLHYDGETIHNVAGKCGVFAETDINGLQKQGVPSRSLMASLFEAIVLQNLSVLTRGFTLLPKVVLLGGPNTFIPGMLECWRSNIGRLWKDRGIEVPAELGKEAITVPSRAQYFAAIGAAEFGRIEHPNQPCSRGLEDLREHVRMGDSGERIATGLPGLCNDGADRAKFLSRYKRPGFHPANLEAGTVFRAYLGIDGGSTSTKGVLLDQNLDVAFKAYRISCGNPIEDAKDIIGKLAAQVAEQNCELRILGVGVTGYAKDMLHDSICADVALVETVAHTQAALQYHPDADVICDVGGQDIKIVLLKNGRVADFKLNTQCSAGNGYFLQSTAERFGYSMDEYADAALLVDRMPDFNFGCAIFLQADIVTFQRQGWSAPEILAGLANVLPKNIWLYVAQFANMTLLGKTFVLQGGTQYNLAAVKAQMNFIRSKFRNSGIEPVIVVHPHAGEAGAIGCAIESARVHRAGRETTFIGVDQIAAMQYSVHRGDDTICRYCSNHCQRTFIDIRPSETDDSIDRALRFGGNESGWSNDTGQERQDATAENDGPGGRPAGLRRLIVASCEKGATEDVEQMKRIASHLQTIRDNTPNLVDELASDAWKSFYKPRTKDGSRLRIISKARKNIDRSLIRIGVPRVLNMYQHMPFFTAYLEHAGIQKSNIIISDRTTDDMYREGVKRGSIDPCFPSKVALAHVHNLLYEKHENAPLNIVFFPIVGDMPSDLVSTQASRACPTIMGTVETIYAAFTKESDVFGNMGIQYLHPFINLGEPALAVRQLWHAFGGILKLDRRENREAVEAGYKALDEFQARARKRGLEVLKSLEQDNRIGIVVLGRPYHADAGINHGILDEFRKLGYSVLSQESLPADPEILNEIFGHDMRAGYIASPMEIDDVWVNSYSENTSRKVWAAKFVARHENLVGLELSSFKCGHDAPVYSVVQGIVEKSGTPFFSFRDIDENKPAASIKIRIETIAYFLRTYQSALKRHATDNVREDGRHMPRQRAGDPGSFDRII
jgi:predicted CoA-substrate-specific enzyme activase